MGQRKKCKRIQLLPVFSTPSLACLRESNHLCSFPPASDISLEWLRPQRRPGPMRSRCSGLPWNAVTSAAKLKVPEPLAPTASARRAPASPGAAGLRPQASLLRVEWLFLFSPHPLRHPLHDPLEGLMDASIAPWSFKTLQVGTVQKMFLTTCSGLEVVQGEAVG